MPRLHRRDTAARTRFTDTQIYALVSGHDYFNEWRQREAPTAGSTRAMLEAWQEWGEELGALHIAAYPGSRPWAWWEFEAPERRQRVDGLPHPFDAPDYPEQHKVLYYGCPGHLWRPDHFEAAYECQCAYLTRLRLVTPGEKRLMQSPDWQCWEEDEDRARAHAAPSLEQIRAWLSEQ